MFRELSGGIFPISKSTSQEVHSVILVIRTFPAFTALQQEK